MEWNSKLPLFLPVSDTSVMSHFHWMKSFLWIIFQFQGVSLNISCPSPEISGIGAGHERFPAGADLGSAWGNLATYPPNHIKSPQIAGINMYKYAYLYHSQMGGKNGIVLKKTTWHHRCSLWFGVPKITKPQHLHHQLDGVFSFFFCPPDGTNDDDHATDLRQPQLWCCL